MKLYYSVRPREALKRQITDLPLGFAHYSYGIVCHRFIDMLADLEVDPTELVMPEIYPSFHEIPAEHSRARKPVHLMFKAFDEFRLLKGAYNVAHIAWEYDRLPTFGRLPRWHPKRAHLLNDYVYALSLLDETWVGCSFTKEVLVREGVPNVHVIPAPIKQPVEGPWPNTAGNRQQPVFMQSPLQIIECNAALLDRPHLQNTADAPGEALFLRIADCRSRGGKVFVSVLNPHDPRKNIGALLAGFQRYWQRYRPDDLLIVKILVDGQIHTLEDVLRVVLPRRFAECAESLSLIDCANMLLICGWMTDAEMDRLYGAADFYLCTSSAEGQNLPLLEAMARGLVPISPANTAMADYISIDTAFVIPTHNAPVYFSVAEAYGLVDVQWQEASAADVTTALADAATCSDGELRAKRMAAIRLVAERYSPAAVSGLVKQRLDAIECISGRSPIAEPRPELAAGPQ